MTFSMVTRSTLKTLDTDESLVSDAQFDVFDPILSVGLVRHSLNSLAEIDSEDLQFMTRVKISLYPFNLEQTYLFPELIYWCSVVYCHYAYVLQNHNASKLICSFTLQSVRAILGFSDEFFLNYIPFSELIMIDSYKSYDPEKKGQFLKLILKPDSDTYIQEYPCPTSNFREEVQVMFSLLSQVLGLDHDKEVSEIMLSFLMIYYEAEKSKSENTVAFNQFLNESIHGKFVNFQYIQKFRYQDYLLKFLVEFNLAELRGLVPERENKL